MYNIIIRLRYTGSKVTRSRKAALRSNNGGGSSDPPGRDFYGFIFIFSPAVRGESRGLRQSSRVNRAGSGKSCR